VSVGRGDVGIAEAEAVEDVVGECEDAVLGADQEPGVDQTADDVLLVGAGAGQIGRHVRVGPLVGDPEQRLGGLVVEGVALDGAGEVRRGRCGRRFSRT